jgi:hypothetical protein
LASHAIDKRLINRSFFIPLSRLLIGAITPDPGFSQALTLYENIDMWNSLLRTLSAYVDNLFLSPSFLFILLLLVIITPFLSIFSSSLSKLVRVVWAVIQDVGCEIICFTGISASHPRLQSKCAIV